MSKTTATSLITGVVTSLRDLAAMECSPLSFHSLPHSCVCQQALALTDHHTYSPLGPPTPPPRPSLTPPPTFRVNGFQTGPSEDTGLVRTTTFCQRAHRHSLYFSHHRQSLLKDLYIQAGSAYDTYNSTNKGYSGAPSRFSVRL